MHKIKYNEEQLAALRHVNGPALVIAGPGSGKTTTLTGRITCLIRERKIPPSQILVITYTKEAAASMQKRFLSENPDSAPVTFGTFHAIFYHILKTEYSLQADCLLSAQEKKFYLLPILKKHNIDLQMTEEILQYISMRKNGEKTGKTASLSLKENVRETVFREYISITRKNGRIDFEDMLLLTKQLFQERKEVLKKWQERFRYILVDEFQDTNRIQYELLRMLASPGNHIFAVGDDDQSIYGFRGATPAILQRFLNDYPEAEKYYLMNNYRSGYAIVDFADKVISQNRERLLKNPVAMEKESGNITVCSFREAGEEYRYMAERIRKIKEENPQLTWKDFAVLCRTNRETENVGAVFENENIPCNGRKSKDRGEEEKQDMEAYRRLSEGEGSRQDLLRIMNKPDRGLKRGYITEEGADLVKIERNCRKMQETAAAEQIRILNKQLQILKKMPEGLKHSYIRKGMGYERYEREKTGAENDTEMAGRKIGKQEAGTENAGLTTEKKEGVQLLTMHAAKGLEFYYVCIPNVQEGRIPYGKMLSEEQVEEERRLFYVAVTRAKKVLDILYLKGTKERPGLPSRFLSQTATAKLKKQSYSSEESTNSSNSWSSKYSSKASETFSYSSSLSI